MQAHEPEHPDHAKYMQAIEWIALNDDPSELRYEEVFGTITVKLVADLFDVADSNVAMDVVIFRERH